MPIKKKSALKPKSRVKKTTIKDLESRLDVLTSVLTDFVQSQKQAKSVQVNEQPQNQQQAPTGRRSRRKIDWHNEFVDDGVTHAEDKVTDQLLAKIRPVEKGTRKTNMATSICRECGVSESVPIQVIFESKHTCSSCLRKKIGSNR